MKSHWSFYFPAILILIALQACTKPVTQPRIVYCPVHEQNCRPMHWSGLDYDTSRIVRQYNDWYYEFMPVSSLNTHEDEWGLTFIDSAANAIMSCTREGRQTARFTEFSNFNRGRDVSGIGEPLPGNVGAFALHGDQLIFAGSAREGMIGKSMLYTARLNGSRIEAVRYAGDHLHWDEYTWFSQPAFSPCGNVLFLAAERPYGRGGTDIWFSLKKNGKWTEPVNCGQMVNSQCDELTPYISHDGKTLYFASAGHSTVGGFDIFQSDIKKDFWADVNAGRVQEYEVKEKYFSAAVNMRPPLNTPADELFPSAPADEEIDFYYCSNQADFDTTTISSGFDIYVRHRVVKEKAKPKEEKQPDIDITVAEPDVPEPEMPDIPEEPVVEIPQTFVLEGKIEQRNDQKKLPGAYVKAISARSGKLVKKTNADNSARYRMELPKGEELLVTAMASARFHDTYQVYVGNNDTLAAITHDFSLPMVFTLRINFPTDEYQNPYQYTLDSNGAETLATWQSELDNIAQNIKKYKDHITKLVFVGHTDDVGTDAYNIALGRRRVNFIVDQLVQRGVPRKLLDSKTKGEQDMLPRRPGESLQMYRKRCRRVEMTKVLKKEK